MTVRAESIAQPGRIWKCGREGCDNGGIQQTQGRLKKWCSSRCRKIALYSRPCPACGAAMNGSDGLTGLPDLCSACHHKKQRSEARWSREAIVVAMQEWAREYGDPPSALHWQRAGGDSHPSTTWVLCVFGSWNAAIEAAGLVALPTGLRRDFANRRQAA